MKLKIALAVFTCAVIALSVWHYVNTGQDPMIEIMKRVVTFVKKYCNNGEEDESYENNTSRPTVSASTSEVMEGKQTDKTNIQGTSSVLPDQHNPLPPGFNPLK